ncbi:MAG: hypothetical protein JNK74_23380 [Candidatus Hydrogenedentes bacterium]|nr:hypothetical protein [Candidatus Hydrogenedentota bacterium]
MESWVLFLAIVVTSLAFVMWLAMFALSRGMNSNLETDAESRRIAGRQIVFGALLLAVAVALSICFFNMDRPEIIPEIGPGLPDNAPLVKKEMGAHSGARIEAPKVAEPTPPAPAVPPVNQSGEGKPLPNPAVI